MPPSSTTHNQSEPLIPSKLSAEHVEPLSYTTTTAIKALSVARIALGASTIIAPRWTCALFQFPIPASVSILARLFGVRELVLGELLITAEDKGSPTGGRRELRRTLLANLGTDTVDVCSVVFAVATGTIGRVPGALFGAGAVVALGLGGLGLRGL
jgi:hypothetical protein